MELTGGALRAHAAGGQTTRGSQSSADPAAATEFPNELRTTPPRVSRSATVVESGTASANVAFTTVICSVDASVHSPEYSSPSGAEKAKSRSISARSTRLSGLATPGQKARGTPPRSVGMSKATVRRSPGPPLAASSVVSHRCCKASAALGRRAATRRVSCWVRSRASFETSPQT